MVDNRYDGRKPEPPYECPSCAALRARVKGLEGVVSDREQLVGQLFLSTTLNIEQAREAADSLIVYFKGQIRAALDAAKEGK